MQQLQDLSPFWITRHTKDWSITDSAFYVSNLLPKGYPAYCKIFHLMFEDLSIQDRSLNFIEAEKQRIPRAKRKDQRILWGEVAQQHQLTLHAEFSLFSMPPLPNYIVHPPDARLEEPALTELVHLLSHFTDQQECYLCHAYETLERGIIPGLLFKGTLDEIFNPAIFEHGPATSIYYWWAKDQSWCVGAHWDLSFTLVGGEEDLINALIANSILECVQINESTRIDYRADEDNCVKSQNP